MMPMRFISGGCDGLVKFWAFNNETKKFDEEVITTRTDWIKDVSFAQFNTMGLTLPADYHNEEEECDLVAICAEKNALAVLRRKKEKWEEYKFPPAKAQPLKLSWNVDGNSLAVSYDDNTVQVFEEMTEGKWGSSFSN